ALWLLRPKQRGPPALDLTLEAQANPAQTADAQCLADHLLDQVDVDEGQQPPFGAVGEKLLDPGGALAAENAAGEVATQRLRVHRVVERLRVQGQGHRAGAAPDSIPVGPQLGEIDLCAERATFLVCHRGPTIAAR